jgi:hypothetical protein
MGEEIQAQYDTACTRFRDLRCDFKILHRLKYEEYIVKTENNIKTDPRSFFKFTDLKRNSSGYPSTMFLGDQAARDLQEIANLFANFFQSVYIRDDATSSPSITPSNAEHSQQKVSLRYPI